MRLNPNWTRSSCTGDAGLIESLRLRRFQKFCSRSVAFSHHIAMVPAGNPLSSGKCRPLNQQAAWIAPRGLFNSEID